MSEEPWLGMVPPTLDPERLWRFNLSARSRRNPARTTPGNPDPQRPDSESTVEVNVEKPAPTLAKVSFNVQAEEFEAEYQKGLRQFGKNVRMKGFRPGKVPTKVIEKAHGTEVRQKLKEDFLRKAYREAVEKEELRPISHPRIELDEDAEAGTGFSLTFEISLRPEIVLPDYKGLSIESELEPVLDQNVDNAIDEIKQQQSRPETAEDGIGDDGMVVCDVAFVYEDEVVFEREGLRLSAKTTPPGVEPEAFADALKGAKAGDVIEVAAVLPDVLEKEEARGQDGTCRLSVKEAYDVVPPTDEELFTLLDVEDEAAMRTKVREQLEEIAVQREESRIESALIDRLIGEVDMDLPEPLVEEQTESRIQQLRERLSQQGASEEDIEQQVEEQRPTARSDSEKGIRALLIVESIGDKEELLVTNEEMEAELAVIAERNGAEVEEVRQYYAENNLGQQMAIELLEKKVRTFLRENAEVQEPT